MSLKFTEHRPKANTWRLNSALLTDPTTLPHIATSLSDYFKTNSTPDINPLSIWEAHKCTIRGELIRMGAYRKRERENEIKSLTEKIRTLESLHKQSLTEHTANELLNHRKSLQQIFDTRAKRFLFFRKKIYYEQGNKTGSLLARAIKNAKTQQNISGIRTKEGKLDITTEKIAHHFHNYYTSLYNLPNPQKPSSIQGTRLHAIRQYLIDSKLPSLSTEDITQLENPIETYELQQVIKHLKTGKSPGPDGFTAIYYKTFQETLLGPLLKALNYMSKPREIPADFLKAHITILPKPNKDLTECASYRPISLLNLDVKLMSKIIANRLKPLLHKLIGSEQAGFMPGRETRDNVIKTLNLMHAAGMRKFEGLLLSTDAEKAFDRVAWDFMLETCRFIGLGNNMMSWISTLYKNPSAQLKINGSLSSTVEIKNGTRQGCPLSPLLFILTLEPFVRRIVAERAIQGFEVGKKEYKMVAYADDLLFFIRNPHISLPSLMKEFSIFGYFSNLKINYTKSEILNVSIPTNKLDTIQSNCPFKWVNTALKYLGIWLTPKLSQIFEYNFTPLLKTICSDLQNWHSKGLSWFGRAAICKMVILPRVLYLFRNLPIKIPQNFFKVLHTTQTKFIWAHKKPRVRFSRLTKPKDKGGMGIPDFRAYYMASHITRIIDWHCHSTFKDWVEIEEKLSHTPIKYSPWIRWSSLPAEMRLHPLVGTTLSIFHKLTKLTNFSSLLSPLTPLQNNPNFPPGMGNRSLQANDTNKPLLASQCFHNQEFRDFTDLKHTNKLPDLQLWTYFQCRSFLNRTQRKQNFNRPLTELESVCQTEEPISKVTSLAYRWIQDGEDKGEGDLRESWSRALGIPLTTSQWMKACVFAHKCSLSTKTQETAYKLLTQWYATPVKLHSWFPDHSDTCWRCNSDKGSLLHIWWQCPILNTFWAKVREMIYLITETKLKLDAAACLLHVTEFPIKRYKHSLTKHLLNAAKAVIPLYWKSTKIPSIQGLA